MPHQLRLGLRASHDLIELGQERLRGRLVTELQIDEYLARIGEAAAHSVGLHALLGTEPFVLVEVRLPGVVVLDGVLDVNGGHVSSSDRWKTRLRRRHTPFYPRSWGFPPPYAGPVPGSQELADRASAVCRRPRSAKALREELVALVRRAVPFGGYNFPLTDPVSRVGTSPLADVPGLSWPRLPALICSRYLTPFCRWDRMLETGVTVSSLMRETDGHPGRSLLWRDVQSQLGVSDTAIVVVADRHGCWGVLDLWRYGGSFQADE